MTVILPPESKTASLVVITANIEIWCCFRRKFRACVLQFLQKFVTCFLNSECREWELDSYYSVCILISEFRVCWQKRCVWRSALLSHVKCRKHKHQQFISLPVFLLMFVVFCAHGLHFAWLMLYSYVCSYIDTSLVAKLGHIIMMFLGLLNITLWWPLGTRCFCFGFGVVVCTALFFRSWFWWWAAWASPWPSEPGYKMSLFSAVGLWLLSGSLICSPSWFGHQFPRLHRLSYNTCFWAFLLSKDFATHPCMLCTTDLLTNIHFNYILQSKSFFTRYYLIQSPSVLLQPMSCVVTPLSDDPD